MDQLLRDVRLAIRTLAARRGWTVAAILCLAIATGANTAGFTLLNGLLLRPLPFDEPERLIVVAMHERGASGVRPFTLDEYRALADESAPDITLLARTFLPLSLATADGARMAQAEIVSDNYFDVLRVRPLLGRFFEQGDDRAGDGPPVILSHRLWSLRFGGDPAAIGRSIRINATPAQIIGVAPPGFSGAMQLIAADLWIPAAVYPALAGMDAAASPEFGVMGRLTPELGAEEAQARLTTLLASRQPTASGRGGARAVVKPAAGFGVPVALQGAVLTLSGVVYVVMALLMGLACANVAALVLARGAGRTREVAVRLSLGASRRHVARQLLTESAVLALAGSAAGTLVALWTTRFFVAHLTTPFDYVSYAIDVSPDVRVFAYAAVGTALAAGLCGLAPLAAATRVDAVAVLKQSGGRGRSPTAIRSLNTVVALQFAISTVLLAGSSLLIRGYLDARAARLTFDAGQLVAATLDVSQLRREEPSAATLYRTAVDRLSRAPGVTAVAVAQDIPLRGGRRVAVSSTVRPAGRAAERIPAQLTMVSASFFRTVGLPFREGRDFGDGDRVTGHTVIVSESLARTLWPEGSAPDRTVFIDPDGARPLEVVGVVASAATGPDDRDQTIYQPLPEAHAPRMTILLRVEGEAAAQFATIRGIVGEIDGDLALLELETVERLLDRGTEGRQFATTVLLFVGSLGLLLSALGLYGVVAYGVRARTGELGIRLALGARPGDIRRLVLRQGYAVVAAGLGAGAIAVALALPAARARLFGLGTVDPLLSASVIVVLLTSATLALYLPARWASRLLPAEALRME